MYYLDRQTVCDRLRLNTRQGYRIVRASRLSYIASSDVVALLNDARRADECVVREIPTDIVTADELADRTGIPARRLLAMTRRTKRVMPHWRINKQTTRFRLSTAEQWLKRESRHVR